MGDLEHIKEAVGKTMIDWEAEFRKMERYIDEAFKKHVKIEHIDGWASYGCKKNLWGCSGPDNEELLQIARHYFRQYFEDGEYDE